VQPFETVVC